MRLPAIQSRTRRTRTRKSVFLHMTNRSDWLDRTELPQKEFC